MDSTMNVIIILQLIFWPIHIGQADPVLKFIITQNLQ